MKKIILILFIMSFMVQGQDVLESCNNQQEHYYQDDFTLHYYIGDPLNWFRDDEDCFVEIYSVEDWNGFKENPFVSGQMYNIPGVILPFGLGNLSTSDYYFNVTEDLPIGNYVVDKYCISSDEIPEGLSEPCSLSIVKRPADSDKGTIDRVGSYLGNKIFSPNLLYSIPVIGPMAFTLIKVFREIVWPVLKYPIGFLAFIFANWIILWFLLEGYITSKVFFRLGGHSKKGSSLFLDWVDAHIKAYTQVFNFIIEMVLFIVHAFINVVLRIANILIPTP